ncbi:hypothetical protein CCACVL1_19533 [Corchorus capsularis]|uniref:Uncharacterized protein n=1 Tax=Corchorus capsularis TaxID=210143 RepID=A0A1R3HGG9_COCAP|nr:hypothetical protein CCACVL1_19533 [Corchorus capsularis]
MAGVTRGRNARQSIGYFGGFFGTETI